MIFYQCNCKVVSARHDVVALDWRPIASAAVFVCAIMGSSWAPAIISQCCCVQCNAAPRAVLSGRSADDRASPASSVAIVPRCVNDNNFLHLVEQIAAQSLCILRYSLVRRRLVLRPPQRKRTTGRIVSLV